MTSKLTITTTVKDTGLAEIYQSMGTKFALLRPKTKTEFERITPFVLCRDFLVDVYTFSREKQKFGIYGMSFDGTKESPATDGVYLVLNFPSETIRTTFEKQLPCLQKIEEQNEIPITKFISHEKTQGVVFGDKRWLQNCLSFSLYTFLLRVLCYSLPSTKDDWVVKFGNENKAATDAAYAKSVHPTTWARVFSDLDSIKTKSFCGFPVNAANIRKIHHNSGFISVFGSHREINVQSVKENQHYQQMRENNFTMATK